MNVFTAWVDHHDVFVSFFAMPIGITICFGPALAYWLLKETKGEQNGDQQ